VTVGQITKHFAKENAVWALGANAMFGILSSK
jgi:hypothetical protein